MRRLLVRRLRTVTGGGALIALLAFGLLPASAATATRGQICVDGNCVEVGLLGTTGSIGGEDTYGAHAALTAQIEGRSQVVHPVEGGVVASVCAPDCKTATDIALLESRDWLSGIPVEVFAGDPGDPRSRARRVRFEGEFVRDPGLWCLGIPCGDRFYAAYVATGRVEFPSSFAPGLYDLWFVAKPPSGPNLVALSQVGFSEKPRFRLVNGRNNARPIARVEASVLRRASKRHPIRIVVNALRRGPRGWGNPHMECPPKGTDGGCYVFGLDSRYVARKDVKLTRPTRTANVAIALPAAGRWRIDVSVRTTHVRVDGWLGKRFWYVRR